MTDVYDEFRRGGPLAKIDRSLIATSIRTVDMATKANLMIMRGDQAPDASIAGATQQLDPSDVTGSQIVLEGENGATGLIAFDTQGGASAFRGASFVITNWARRTISSSHFRTSSDGTAGTAIGSAFDLVHGASVEVTFTLDNTATDGIAVAMKVVHGAVLTVDRTGQWVETNSGERIPAGKAISAAHAVEVGSASRLRIVGGALEADYGNETAISADTARTQEIVITRASGNINIIVDRSRPNGLQDFAKNDVQVLIHNLSGHPITRWAISAIGHGDQGVQASTTEIPSGSTGFVGVEVDGVIMRLHVNELGGSGGDGVTNLTYSATPAYVQIHSDTGTDATILPANDTDTAGVILPSHVIENRRGKVWQLDLGGAARYLRLVQFEYNTLHRLPNPDLYVTLEPRLMHDAIVVVSGAPASGVTGLNVIADIRGGTAKFDNLRFMLVNNATVPFNVWNIAGGTGPTGGAFTPQDRSRTVHPGEVCQAVFTAGTGAGNNHGLFLATKMLFGSSRGLFVESREAADPVTAADWVLVGDDSDGRATRRMTITQLKALVGGGSSPLNHIRRCAIRGLNGNFVASDFQTPATGVESVTHILTTPTWSDGLNRQMAFAVPTSAGDITAIYFSGDRVFNAINGFEKASYTLDFAGDTWALWVNTNVRPISSGISVEIEP